MSDVTREEFDALEARVTALEQDVGIEPPIDTDNDVEVKSIACLIELFGVNTFSSMDENNVWGSWPADYRPNTVIESLRWILGDSGFVFNIREYHYAGRDDFQRPWLQQIKNAFPDCYITMCVGANGSINDVSTMISLFDEKLVDFVEGINEPNTDFGSGQVQVDVTMDIQNTLWNNITVLNVIVGPSIVTGIPNPEGWITSYFGQEMNAVNQVIHFGNGHYYPPRCPDIIGNGESLAEYVGGLWTAYGNHGITLTEFHPTLYNTAGQNPDQSGWDGLRDAYYTMMALLRCEKCTVFGLWWYALFDYGETYKCGLFPKDATNPRPVAHMLKYLCSICKDAGDKYRILKPLEIQVSHNSDYWSIYGNSAGVYYLFIWQAGQDVGGSYHPVDIFLDTTHDMTEYDLITRQEGQTVTNQKSITIMLNNTVKLIKIT